MRNRRKDYAGIEKVCLFCKDDYWDVPNRRIKFCSMQCFKDYKKELFACKFCKKTYVTTKSRNIIYCSRGCMSEDYRGKSRPGVGKKISKAKLRNGIPSDGRRIRKTAKYYKARVEALERDDFECQICFQKGTDTNHIKTVKQFPELAYEINNLITLCKKCHDTKVSRHEPEWEEYFNRKINLS